VRRVCCWALREQEISKYNRSRRSAATAPQHGAHSGKCGQCRVDSRGTRLNTDLLPNRTHGDGRADEGGVLRVSSADRGPLPDAGYGPAVARAMRPVLRLSAGARPIVLHQGQPALLQTRLRTVSPRPSSNYLLPACDVIVKPFR